MYSTKQAIILTLLTYIKLLVLVQVCLFPPFKHEMKLLFAVDINGYNFLNNGLILNLLPLLELSKSPLCTPFISFDHFDITFNYYVL